MTYSAGSSFTMNSWCDIENLSYSWTYEYMDMPETDADDTLDYRSDLAANMTSSIVWTEQESDYEIDTFFTVSYNSTEWMSQEDASSSANDTFSHLMTCRPSFAYAPVIDEVVLEGSTLTVSFDMEFSTMGLQNCGEMFAQIDVYDSDEVIRGTKYMETTEANQYVNNDNMPAVKISGIEELESCYKVHITYGQVNKTSS